MIREAVGNTVVRFYSDKKTAAQVAQVMQMSVREYNDSQRFFLADKNGKKELFDESGMIFHPKSLERSASYKQDFQKLMDNSKPV